MATDQGGRYRLELPAGKDLRILFSFVGMQEQEVVFQDQKVLDITLKEEIAEMEEVIVTGYSTRKVSEMTGAVQQFRGKDIVRSVTGGNLMNALKGHTTGLQITGAPVARDRTAICCCGVWERYTEWMCSVRMPRLR